MIKREEAKEKLAQDAFFEVGELQVYEADKVDDKIDEIYDSIGSCGECEHWQENYWSNIKPYACSWMEQTFMNEDWFCANFIRKENDKDM